MSVISKIIEKIVCKRFYNYLTENNLLYNLQFAFQSGKSTVHPLIPLVNYIADAFNKNEYVVAVFLDLAKAFDLVLSFYSTKKNFKKLGVHGVVLKWFENYLKDRKQFVMIMVFYPSFLL